MVAVVVRYQGEVQLGGKHLGAAMVKVDRKERLRRLDDESHVVYEPHRWPSGHLHALDFGKHLVECVFVPLQRREPRADRGTLFFAKRRALQGVVPPLHRRYVVDLALETREIGLLLRAAHRRDKPGRQRTSNEFASVDVHVTCIPLL